METPPLMWYEGLGKVLHNTKYEKPALSIHSFEKIFNNAE